MSKRFQHGESRTRLYRIWKGIRTRCNNSKSPHFKHYGAKGVTHCVEWSEYPEFADWAKKNGYRDDLSIDRIDPDSEYSPSNCRWIPIVDNIRRARSAKGEGIKQSKLTVDQVLEIRESTKTQQALADEYNVSRFTVRAILYRDTWRHV